VPGPRQVTTPPSPISQRVETTSALNVTDTPPADKLRVCGPNVVGPGFEAHIHVGKPTRPNRSGPGSGTIPIDTGSNLIDARNCSARARGSTISDAGPHTIVTNPGFDG